MACSDFFKNRPIGLYIFLLGGLFTLGFAPFFLWPFSLLALGGLFLLSQKALNFKQAFILGWLFGLGHHLTALYWLPRSFYIDSGQQVWPMIYQGVPALLGLCIYLSVFIGLTCGFTYFIKNKYLAPVGFSLFWLIGELIKSWPSFGFPWNLAGYIWANNLELMQISSIGSIYLMSFIVVFTGALLLKNLPHTIAAILTIALVWAFGHQRLQQAPNTAMQAPQATVRLVQANIDIAHKWDTEKRRDFLNQHLLLSTQQNLNKADVIIWPETAVAFFLNQEPFLREYLTQFLSPNQTLITGFPKEEITQTETKYFNSIAVLNSQGDFISQYNKHILVPFGETIPFASFFDKYIRTLSYNRANYTSGTGTVSLKVNNHLTALPLICYEAAFAHFVGKNVTGQTFLLNLTNDNWFDKTTAPHQHFYMARLRAVETGLPLVRAANTGITAVIDGYGRIIHKLNTHQKRVFNIEIPQKNVKKNIWIEVASYL